MRGLDISTLRPYIQDMHATQTLPTTRIVKLLIRDATGEVLREALPLEVAAAKASGHAWMPYTLHCPDGTIPCFIETREVALTDAEYNEGE